MFCSQIYTVFIRTTKKVNGHKETRKKLKKKKSPNFEIVIDVHCFRCVVCFFCCSSLMLRFYLTLYMTTLYTCNSGIRFYSTVNLYYFQLSMSMWAELMLNAINIQTKPVFFFKHKSGASNGLRHIIFPFIRKLITTHWIWIVYSTDRRKSSQNQWNTKIKTSQV